MSLPFASSNLLNLQNWHYTSRSPLSAAQLIARHSIDARTVALIWVLLEHGVSLTVAGLRMGVGKTTTLNALLQFLPTDATVYYMEGVLENFSFTQRPGVNPSKTYAICNEINDYPPYYMWGERARRFLTLPSQGYRIATTLHGNSLHDVLTLYRKDVHLNTEEIRRLGIIVTIDRVPQQRGRRWMTTHFIWPYVDAARRQKHFTLLLSRWHRGKDAFKRASGSALADLAKCIGMAPHVFTATLTRRVDCLRALSVGQGADMDAVAAAINELRAKEEEASGS